MTNQRSVVVTGASLTNLVETPAIEQVAALARSLAGDTIGSSFAVDGGSPLLGVGA